MPSHGFNNTLYVNIHTDFLHSETEWYLYNSSSNNNTEIEAYNDYEKSCSVTRHHIIIPDGCYTLVFDDTSANGICCEWGYGRYEVKLNDTFLTFANLQTYEGYGTQIYFCTHLFHNMNANSSKALKFTSNDNSKIIIKNNDNEILYFSDDFVPFGKAYDFLLPIDQIYQIIIYKKSNNNKWKEIIIFNSTDDWDIQLASYANGMYVYVQICMTGHCLSYIVLILFGFFCFSTF